LWQERTVNKDAFFSALRANDGIDVEGRLDGNVVSAEKVEFED
jgi:hypothetical protein